MSNKEVLKVWQYWILEEHALSDIFMLSYAYSKICLLLYFSSSENWLKLLDPLFFQLTFLLFTIDIYTLRNYKLFCILLLGHQGNSATWVFTFPLLLTFCASFYRFIRAVWFDFFLLFLIVLILIQNICGV